MRYFNPMSVVVTTMVAMATAVLGQQPDSTNRWGYGYDSLLQDLGRWRQSAYVRVDSIGASVQNRALWMVSVTEGSEIGKQRVFVHARTHPAEVQAFYVTREMLRYLLGTTAAAAQIRREFVFQFVPMYNPDGVELGHARLNARLVDLEGNWDKPVMEPEVIALRAKFQSLMQTSNPVRVALNMHADQVNCARFFFYHDPVATSQTYGTLERDYIGKSQGYFPGGIQPWNYVVSWSDGFKTQYPESYWWTNFHEAVMALTYEDMNCPNAGKFDSTGRALVLGTVDYLRARPVSMIAAGRGASLRPMFWSGSAPAFPLYRNGRLGYVDAQGRGCKIENVSLRR